MQRVKVHFLGASGTVTGSKFYLETPELNLLVDCGMFQGIKALREFNWKPLPINVPEIDVVLLTHGHLDHTGYLPRLVKEGFKGQILGSAPTLAIAEIILLDSAKIHEEEAKRANEEGYGKHQPALPFYTIEDAKMAIKLFSSVEKGVWNTLSKHIKFRCRYNGHIIGATFIELDIFEKRYVFSGDIGRRDDLLLAPPERPKWADYLFVESTYGDKNHPKEDVSNILVSLINRTIHNRGILIIPSFAVERLQSLMYQLWVLYKRNRIPNIPIYIDSPMGNNVLEVFENFPQWHQLSMKEYRAMCNHIRIVTSYKETWETIDDKMPKIVIAGSGMVTGGRVLTYLKQFLDHSSTTVLLVGYQAEGTRGRDLLEGVRNLKLFGKYYEVKAKIAHLESLSAHADQAGLMYWLQGIENIPEKVFLVHGEPKALEVFGDKLTNELNWHVCVPELFDTMELMI